MRKEWVKTDRTIEGFACARRKVCVNLPNEPTEYEYTIAGARGEIWENNDSTYRAVLKPGLFQNKALRLSTSRGKVASKTDECIITFDKVHLPVIVKVIKAPSRSSAAQVKYANTF